jgi:hypothetical protein
MRAVRPVTDLLRRDENYPPARPDELQVGLEDTDRIVAAHVLDDVSEQQSVIARRDGIRRIGELRAGICRQAPRPGNGHRIGIVVDADGAGAKVMEIAADPAAYVQGAAQAEPADVPPVRSLDVDDVLPPDRPEPDQPFGIVPSRGSLPAVARAGLLAAHRTPSS